MGRKSAGSLPFNFQLGGAGIGNSARKHAIASDEKEISNMLITLRNNVGIFANKSCDYFKIWAQSMMEHAMFNISGYQEWGSKDNYTRKFKRGSNAKVESGRGEKGKCRLKPSEIIKRNMTGVSKTAITDLPELVPRLKDLKTEEQIVSCWRTGEIKVRGVVRVYYPLRLLQKAENRRSIVSNYTNSWWREVQKSAFDRIRRIVKNISVAYPGKPLSLDVLGDDSEWREAIASYQRKKRTESSLTSRGS